MTHQAYNTDLGNVFRQPNTTIKRVGPSYDTFEINAPRMSSEELKQAAENTRQDQTLGLLYSVLPNA